MSVDDLDFFSDDDVSEDEKKGEDGWEGGFSIDDEEGDMVYFEPIGEVADPGAALVGVGYDHDFVAAVDEFG